MEIPEIHYIWNIISNFVEIQKSLYYYPNYMGFFWCSVPWQVAMANLIFNGFLTHIVINFYRVQCTAFLMLNSIFISWHRMMKIVIAGCTLHHKYSSSAAQLSLGFFPRKFLKWQFYDSVNQNKLHKFPSPFTYVIINESCWLRKMNTFTYFYEVFLQKCRDDYVGLWYRLSCRT